MSRVVFVEELSKSRGGFFSGITNRNLINFIRPRWQWRFLFENCYCKKSIQIKLFESGFLNLPIQIMGCPVTKHFNTKRLKQI